LPRSIARQLPFKSAKGKAPFVRFGVPFAGTTISRSPKSNRARSLSIHVLNPQSFRAFFHGSLCIKAVEVSPFNFVKSALLDSATFNY
jgi:hypothetical protein